MELKRYENFLRKLHSLAGIIPVGIFLTFHLSINYTATWGEEAYNQASGFMVNLPFKLFLEAFIIFCLSCFTRYTGFISHYRQKTT